MKYRLIAVLTFVTMVLSMPVTVFAAIDSGDVAKIGEQGYTTLQAALDAVQDGETIELLRDVDMTSNLSAHQAVSFTLTSAAGGPYTIRAVDASANELFDTAVAGEDALLSISGTAQVTLGNVILDGGGVTQTVLVDTYGAIYPARPKTGLTIDGATITGGSTNRGPAGHRYAGGVYVSGTATLNMVSGSITGNDEGLDTASDLQYASDVWIGPNAKGAVSGGTVGNVYVHADAKSEQGTPADFSVTGGSVENVYVSTYADSAGKVHSPTFTYTGGSISTLHLATVYNGLQEGVAYYWLEDGQANVIENPVAGMIYQSGPTQLEIYRKDITVTEGKISETVTATLQNPSVIGGQDVYQWYQLTTNGSVAVTGATDATFAIPTDLTVGIYQFYCVVDTGSNGIPLHTSNTVAVTVTEEAGNSNHGSGKGNTAGDWMYVRGKDRSVARRPWEFFNFLIRGWLG